MLKFKISILFIFISYLCVAQGFNSGANQTNFYSEINYELINEKIIIPVEIEGLTYKFMLDTGAPNIITTNLQKKITTNFQQTILISDANSKIDSLNLVTIPEMKIGDISYYNIPSLINKTENNQIFECLKVDGFIGSNLLRNSILQILPKERLIILTDNKKKLSLKRKNSTEIEFPDNQSTPYIRIELNADKKANEQVYFDTGMDGFYDLANQHLKIFQKEKIFKINSESKGSQGTGLFGSENTSQYYQVVVPNIKIVNANFENATIVTTNDINSRIGTKILSYGNVTIDYLNKRFYYDPFKNIINLEEKSFGFNPTVIDQKYVIGLVWDDNLKNKIKFGDQIIEINGEDFTKSNFCDFINAKSIFEENDRIEMTIKNNEGIVKKLTVDKNYR